jgi:hypothetical protein
MTNLGSFLPLGRHSLDDRHNPPRLVPTPGDPFPKREGEECFRAGAGWSSPSSARKLD